MRISKLADYATLIMSYLAKQPNSVLSSGRIAKALHLNTPTVSKILKILAEADLVSSVRGAEGGYHLGRLAENITLAQIIATIDGDLALTMCCEKVNVCALDATCTVKGNWKKINGMIHGLLGQFTLEDMTKPL